MSLKPKKHSEQIKIMEKMKQKESKMETRYELPPYIMIVSEGIKTEPYYLRGFTKKINAQYKSIIKEERICVYGTGRNTKGLLKFVEDKVAKGEWEKYQNIWLVYDKDDFPEDSFDNTQFSVEGREDKRYKVAWSNECIELWFLLHFQDYGADNGREQYKKLLNQKFEYSKTREDLYDVIMKNGSLTDAKRRAKCLYESYKESGVKSPSDMVPATRMYELIEELEQYIHE